MVPVEALVKVSGEITSTLDLDRVLKAVVNEPATVIPYEKAAIALEQRSAQLFSSARPSTIRTSSKLMGATKYSSTVASMA
jgi:hypothetical protein